LRTPNFYYAVKLGGVCPREDWIEALGYTPEAGAVYPHTVNSTLSDIAKDSAGVRAGLWLFEKVQALACGRGTAWYRMAVRGAGESPLRAMQNLLRIRGNFAQAIADFANRRWLRGISRLFGVSRVRNES